MSARVCPFCSTSLDDWGGAALAACPVCGAVRGDVSDVGGEDAALEAVLIADLREAFDSCSFRAEPASWRRSLSGRVGTALLGSATLELGGRRLGDFQLLYEIGRGGMGVVYRARQVSLNRDVALKLLPMLSSANPSRARRFRTESLAVARLAHPNVIPVFAHGEEEGMLYYAMELLDGASLDTAIHGRPSLLSSTFVRDRATLDTDALDDDDQIADLEGAPEQCPTPVRRSTHEYRHLSGLLAEVAEGLAHAHSQGVLHRDIKPQNLLIAGDGRLRIADFGLAQLTNEPSMTATGEVMGTPAYLAPEQVRAAVGPIDQRTDVYALGATLYELLTGRQPFRGETRDQVLHQIVDREPEAPRHVEATIPVDLETICLRAMAKIPSDRYLSAGALAEDLRRFSAGRPVLAARAGVIRKTRLWAGRHKGASMAIVATVVVVGLAIVLSSSVRASRRADVARLLGRAYEQLVYQDYRVPELALDDIARAEALGADERMLSRVRALALLGASENVQAIEVLEEALQHYTDDRGMTYLLAWAQWRDHRRDASRITFARAEGMPGDLDSDDWFFRGLAIHFADATKALNSYKQAIALRVADHQFHSQAALHLARASNQHMYSTRTLEKLEHADSSLRELIRHGQYDAYPHYLLSITHQLAGDILSEANPAGDEDDARAEFEEALEWAIEGQAIDPFYDRPVGAEAACLERMGRFEDALDARTRALGLASNSDQRCETHHYRWRLHYWLGQPALALDDVQEHAACLPESPFYAHLYPALVHADLGDVEIAVEHARAFADEAPTDPLMLIWSASTLRLLGELDEADALLESRREQLVFPRLPGSKPDGWLEAIYSHVSGEGDWIALSDLIAEVESSRKLRGEAHFHAGVKSLATGRRQEAVDHFGHAVHAADGALGYTFHAGVVLERLRLDSSWPVWMESTFSLGEAKPGGTIGTVHHAGANASLGEDHRD